MTAAVLERTRPATGSRTTSRRPKLRVLDHHAVRQRARRRNALLVLFVIVLLGFFAVAFVHAELVAGQQDLDAVRTRIAEAEAHKARVARAAEEASSPQQIVLRAEELGMVRAYQPVYLQAVSPEREVPVIAALAPAASRPVNQIAVAVPGVSAGISGDASVRVPVSEGAGQVVAVGVATSDDTTSYDTTSDGATGTAASPTSVVMPTPAASSETGSTPVTPAPAEVDDDGGSLGGTSVSVAGAALSGASASIDGDRRSTAIAGTSASGSSIAGASGGATSSSIAGSRAATGVLGEGNGSG